MPSLDAEALLSWQHSGFSLHRSRRVGHEEREDLEQIARYILRNPFSTAKVHFEPGAGSVLYRSLMNKKQGGNFAALSPTDFIAAVTQHIPDKGFQLVRYYGWYSNKARGVRAKTGTAQAEDSAQDHELDRTPTSAQWRRHTAKIWEADDLPAVEEEDVVYQPHLSAQRAFGDGPFLLPGARPGRPEAQNAPEPAREAQNGVDSRSGILETPKELVESSFPLRSQTWKETFCSWTRKPNSYPS